MSIRIADEINLKAEYEIWKNEWMLWIALISCFFSFGVQTAVYFYMKWKNYPLIKKHKYVLQYYSGIVGDGVLIPLINVFAIQIIQQSGGITLSPWVLALSGVGGIIITFVFHYGQQVFKLTNWTMPEVGNWNKMGLYHAIFMFCEGGFLTYSLIIYLTSTIHSVNLPMGWALLGLLLFFITFVYDYWGRLFKRFL